MRKNVAILLIFVLCFMINTYFGDSNYIFLGIISEFFLIIVYRFFVFLV